ncbi:MAG: hypothetical protein IGR92_12345 [Leptolyngbyaceae cyanobacterium T60_A2020_046]|nr:hypothetical protein [Leptolyngbyaceae cyanobacterium T60_A2020_046]
MYYLHGSSSQRLVAEAGGDRAMLTLPPRSGTASRPPHQSPEGASEKQKGAEDVSSAPLV